MIENNEKEEMIENNEKEEIIDRIRKLGKEFKMLNAMVSLFPKILT
ncbi:MAG: hypothetical protein ACTSPD_04365 [Promethearchaeota archaeon]